MKNLSKFLLFVLLVFAGYFSVVVYGQCNNTSIGYICGSGDVCQSDSCLCEGESISSGAICSIGFSTDGVRETITYGATCGDGDGCRCFTPSGVEVNVEIGEYCTRDISLPILTAGSFNIVNKQVTLNFYSTKTGNIIYNGSCGNGSLNTAITGDNSIIFNNLRNGDYNNCRIQVVDNLGNTSAWLNIPSFTINVQGGNTSGGGGGGGGGSSSATCTDLYLTCVDGIYTLKSGYYCVGGNLGKSCGVSSIDIETMELLENIKEKKSTVYEYTPQGIKVRIYVPKFKQSILRRTVLSLNQNLYKAINKKLLKVTDPSYMIENFEYLEADSKILVYKEIGSIVKLYNDFLGIFYLFVDMGKRDYLPLARTYFEAYLKEFVMFNR